MGLGYLMGRDYLMGWGYLMGRGYLMGWGYLMGRGYLVSIVYCPYLIEPGYQQGLRSACIPLKPDYFTCS